MGEGEKEENLPGWDLLGGAWPQLAERLQVVTGRGGPGWAGLAAIPGQGQPSLPHSPLTGHQEAPGPSPTTFTHSDGRPRLLGLGATHRTWGFLSGGSQFFPPFYGAPGSERLFPAHTLSGLHWLSPPLCSCCSETGQHAQGCRPCQGTSEPLSQLPLPHTHTHAMALPASCRAGEWQ